MNHIHIKSTQPKLSDTFSKLNSNIQEPSISFDYSSIINYQSTPVVVLVPNAQHSPGIYSKLQSPELTSENLHIRNRDNDVIINENVVNYNHDKNFVSSYSNTNSESEISHSTTITTDKLSLIPNEILSSTLGTITHHEIIYNIFIS